MGSPYIGTYYIIADILNGVRLTGATVLRIALCQSLESPGYLKISQMNILSIY
jgi:hypothetical protein